MRRLFLLLSTIALVAGTAVLGQSPPPGTADTPLRSTSRQETDARIARLIRTLGSNSYGVRKQANDELEHLGAPAREHLEAALDHNDPEIRLRARDLLQKLKVADLWEPSRVNHRAEGQLASEVLVAMAEQTGNRILVGDQYGKFHDEAIDLDYVEAPFWAVMDALCHRSGNHVRPHYDTRNPGLVVVAGEPGDFPVAYAGPVRAEVTSARRVFIEELDYEDLNSETTHTFQLNFRLMWEDQFRLVAYRSGLQLLDAVTDTGVHLSAAQSAGNGWNVTSRGTRQLSVNLRLHPPPTSATKLQELRLTWGLIAVGDMDSIDVEDLESTPKTVSQDDVQLTVEKVEPGKSKQYEVTVTVVRDRVVPQPREVLYEENSFELYDGQGQKFRKQGQSNTLNDRGVKMKLTFKAPSSDSKPARLRLVYPRLRAQQDLEIVFRDVPLPVSRPD